MDRLAHASVQGALDESVAYGVINEMLIEHKQVLGREGSFIIFPQLRLPWKPEKPGDRRSNVPDIGIGRLGDNGTRLLQGGVEQKAAGESMRRLPDPGLLIDENDIRELINRTLLQAGDQVKAAVKNHAIPADRAVRWIIAVGPYFIIHSFGPFSEAALTTRSHRPNDSGDAELTEVAQLMKGRASLIKIDEPLYRIGTEKAACAIHEYLLWGHSLYPNESEV